MVEHHATLTGDVWPVRSAWEAWQRRRAQYVAWLTESAAAPEPTAWLLAALDTADPGGTPLGYAMVVAGPSGPTWDLGERVGDLESLAVAEDARGEGVGTALADAARRRLHRHGITHWTVTAVESNERAVALYERLGFRPFLRTMVARVGRAN